MNTVTEPTKVAATMKHSEKAEYFETVIIGGGQAGLSAGYHLSRQKKSFVILDANERVGGAWRTRWDSLRVFTPAKYDGLDGWRFPAKGWSFPTKDEMADYMAAYAQRFNLDVRTGVRVRQLSLANDRYIIDAGDRRFEADQVIVATGSCNTPRVPPFANELSAEIRQLHSQDYKSPAQLLDGRVLIVGTGNSGAEIAYEVVRTHRTWMSGSNPPEIPVRHGSIPSRFVLPVVRFLGHHVLNLGTPIGRKLRPKLIVDHTPLIRTKMHDLLAAGVERVERVAGVRDGLPVLQDQRVMNVENVIWCTGYREDFSWIQLPIFAQNGSLLHDRGVATGSPGLFFVGLRFQYAASSDVLPGVGRDARYIAAQIASRSRSAA